MPRTCTVCAHKERQAIDQALVAGRPFRGLSALYRVSEDAIARHSAAHLPRTLVQAQAAQEVAQADTLLDQVQSLHARTLTILAGAEASQDGRLALGAVREARGNLELLARLLGELDDRPVVNVLIAPEWLQTRSVLLQALAPFPEARQVVAAALVASEASLGGAA